LVPRAWRLLMRLGPRAEACRQRHSRQERIVRHRDRSNSARSLTNFHHPY